jgi:hypothetical protein
MPSGLPQSDFGSGADRVFPQDRLHRGEHSFRVVAVEH